VLIKIREGGKDIADSVEPGSELWTGGDEELSAASLMSPDRDFEIGTWYPLDEFLKHMDAVDVTDDASPSAITVSQPGVRRPWHAKIEVREVSAALMLCRSVTDHAARIAVGDKLWVRVE
jgi:hypothetical protein